MHEHGAKPADIVPATPGPAPPALQLIFILERRFRFRRKYLDELVVAPLVLCHRTHVMLSRIQIPTIGSPPFGQSSCPVMNPPFGPTRKAIHSAISSGSAQRLTRFCWPSSISACSP